MKPAAQLGNQKLNKFLKIIKAHEQTIVDRNHVNRFLCYNRYIGSAAQYLHCTFTSAEIELSFPRVLFATHWYIPLSSLFTILIVRCLLSDENLILVLTVRGNPLLVHDIVGSGFPVALQDKVTFSPSFFVTFCGEAVISGLSVGIKIKSK